MPPSNLVSKTLHLCFSDSTLTKALCEKPVISLSEEWCTSFQSVTEIFYSDPAEKAHHSHYRTDFTHHLNVLFSARVLASFLETVSSLHCFSTTSEFLLHHETYSFVAQLVPPSHYTQHCNIHRHTRILFFMCWAHFTEQLLLIGGFRQVPISQPCLDTAWVFVET